jgi:hypothetical protein
LASGYIKNLGIPTPRKDPLMDDWKNTALLVIDVQKGLFEKSIPIYDAEKLLENINHLMTALISLEFRYSLSNIRTIQHFQRVQMHGESILNSSRQLAIILFTSGVLMPLMERHLGWN